MCTNSTSINTPTSGIVPVADTLNSLELRYPYSRLKFSFKFTWKRQSEFSVYCPLRSTVVQLHATSHQLISNSDKSLEHTLRHSTALVRSRLRDLGSYWSALVLLLSDHATTNRLGRHASPTIPVRLVVLRSLPAAEEGLEQEAVSPLHYSTFLWSNQGVWDW